MDTQPLDRSAPTVERHQELEPMPAWLADAWPRIVSLVAMSIVGQTPADRAAIYAWFDAGHQIEYCVDAAKRCVYFGVNGVAFCAFSFDVITGVSADGMTH
jgi:hypothetical protein